MPTSTVTQQPAVPTRICTPDSADYYRPFQIPDRYENEWFLMLKNKSGGDVCEMCEFGVRKRRGCMPVSVRSCTNNHYVIKVREK